MRYEHFQRERLLHTDRAGIVLNAEYLRVVLHRMELTNCKPAPAQSVAGSVRHGGSLTMMLTFTCKSADSIVGLVGSLQNVSIDRCDVQVETNACAKEMKQPTQSFMDAGTQSARVVPMKSGTEYDPQEAFLRVWSDSDWAGNVKDPIEFED